MEIIKSYTDIEQSKVLANILPLESADMSYLWNGISFSEYPVSNQTIFKRIENIPCWSLAALLSVLPDELGDNHFLTLDKEGNEYCCCYEDINGNSFRHTFAHNPIDACVAMIEKLHELNLL